MTATRMNFLKVLKARSQKPCRQIEVCRLNSLQRLSGTCIPCFFQQLTLLDLFPYAINLCLLRGASSSVWVKSSFAKSMGSYLRSIWMIHCKMFNFTYAKILYFFFPYKATFTGSGLTMDVFGRVTFLSLTHARILLLCLFYGRLKRACWGSGKSRV
jgi:hypothetical protein